MRVKWLKYFDQIPSLFLIAKIFDPRVSLDNLDNIIKSYYHNLYPDGDGDYQSSTDIVEGLKRDLVNLYNEYSAKIGIPSQQGPSNPDDDEEEEEEVQETANSEWDAYDFMKNIYSSEPKRRRASSSSSNRVPYELEHYFSMGFGALKRPRTKEGIQFDILRWWSKKYETYPILTLIAKDVLACPASTVAVESAFSTGGNVLDARRSQLTVENLENQLLLGDWVRAEKREQDKPYEEDLLDPQFQYEDGSTGGSSEGDGGN